MKMISTIKLVIFGVACASTAISSSLHFPMPNGLTLHKMKAVSSKPVKTIPTAEHWTSLRPIPNQQDAPKSFKSLALSGLRKRAVKPGYQNISAVDYYDTQYYVEATVGGVTLNMLFDTGIGDSYVYADSFACYDWQGDEADQEECGIGATYSKDFQYGAIEGQHLYVNYSSWWWVSGPVGYSDFEIAGIPASRQEFSIVNATSNFGNGFTSGVLGLAWESLTNAYENPDPFSDDPETRDPYSPVFNTMVKSGVILPYFSVALDRNSSNGVVAWGGVAPVLVDGLSYAITPILIADLTDREGTATAYSFYTIVTDGIQWGQTSDTKKYPYIVDTGTSFLYLPSDLAASVNAAFSPKARWDPLLGAYFVDCDATPPLLSIVIGGMSFMIQSQDLINKELIHPLTGKCITTVSDGGPEGPWILGDVFLKNVLAVFDYGHGQMRFYSRTY